MFAVAGPPHRNEGSRVTPDQRDKLLDLHRAAMTAQFNFDAGEISVRSLDATDDAFRDYLFSLEVSA